MVQAKLPSGGDQLDVQIWVPLSDLRQGRHDERHSELVRRHDSNGAGQDARRVGAAGRDCRLFDRIVDWPGVLGNGPTDLSEFPPVCPSLDETNLQGFLSLDAPCE